MKSTVSVKSLHKKFANFTAVYKEDFEVYEGQMVGLLGPNGAGKTTTLQMLVGHVKPTSGLIKILGLNIPQQATQMRHKLGVVSQFDTLDPDFSVIDNLRTYSTYFGIDNKTFESRAEALLEFASLTKKKNQRISTLSGGMKRRLSIARALINNPKLVILDEPTTGLDPQARQLIWQRLLELKSKNITMILTTHYMEEAERLCDYIMIMDKGKILTGGKPRELIEKYIEKHVIEIIGEKVEDFHNKLNKELYQRCEKLTLSRLYYCHDPVKLIAQANDSNFSHINRQANIEDVFIRLTGRELHET